MNTKELILEVIASNEWAVCPEPQATSVINAILNEKHKGWDSKTYISYMRLAKEVADILNDISNDISNSNK